MPLFTTEGCVQYDWANWLINSVLAVRGFTLCEQQAEQAPNTYWEMRCEKIPLSLPVVSAGTDDGSVCRVRGG